MTKEKRTPANGNVVALPKIIRTKFKENETLDLIRAKQTVFIISGGIVSLSREASSSGVMTVKICTYQQGEFILTGLGEDALDTYVAEIPGEIIEMSREDFERMPKPGDMLRSAISGSAKHDARLKAALFEEISRGLKEGRDGKENKTLRELSTAKAHIGKLETELIWAASELEQEQEAHFFTRLNRDSALKDLEAVRKDVTSLTHRQTSSDDLIGQLKAKLAEKSAEAKRLQNDNERLHRVNQWLLDQNDMPSLEVVGDIPDVPVDLRDLEEQVVQSVRLTIPVPSKAGGVTTVSEGRGFKTLMGPPDREHAPVVPEKLVQRTLERSFLDDQDGDDLIDMKDIESRREKRESTTGRTQVYGKKK